MADFDAEIARLETQLAGLEGSLGGLQGVTGAFRRELDGVGGSLRDAGRDATGMSRSLSSSIGRAFEGLVFDGKKLSETLAGVGRSLSSSALSQALGPVQKSIGSALSGGLQAVLGGLSPFAEGAAFSSGRVAAFARGGVAAFARGGVVDGPTHFPMRGGVGLMGEAGPEAIMPLARGADGRLGVRGGGGGAVSVTMHISTPDVAGFQRSQSQIAAEMTRAMKRGRRNL
jgi:phage-related minor tail protein